MGRVRAHGTVSSEDDGPAAGETQFKSSNTGEWAHMGWERRGDRDGDEGGAGGCCLIVIFWDGQETNNPRSCMVPFARLCDL